MAQSSQGRLPGGGGIGAQPWKMHSIWRGERDQIKFSGLFSEECLCSKAGVLSLSLPFSFSSD